jgi:hypothetical protein
MFFIEDFKEFIVGFNIIGHGNHKERLEWMFDVKHF